MRGAEIWLQDIPGHQRRAASHGAQRNPDFVKPNRQEAEQLLGTPINSLSDAVSGLRNLLRLGAQSAALSLGSEGLLFGPSADAPLIYAPAVSVQPRSTVGCGDSALAGFAFGIASGYSPQDTLRLAAACGGANCLADSPAPRSENVPTASATDLGTTLAQRLGNGMTGGQFKISVVGEAQLWT
jgi:fructose-1-phosphate kinase PfkB-like protein